MFERYVGVDYSGADTAETSIDGIRVYSAGRGERPQSVDNPTTRRTRWSRRELAAWLLRLLQGEGPTLVGIDHAFSFPTSELDGIPTWDQFLDWFCNRWRTDQETVSDAIEAVQPPASQGYRLTDAWSSSAQSIFNQKGVGVFHSTFAGIPWLRFIRRRAPEVFFWPFDGRIPPRDRSVVVEVYPSMFNRRYVADPDCPPKGHRRDAYSACRWLAEADARDLLEPYLEPPLTHEEWERAQREGWILGLR